MDCPTHKIHEIKCSTNINDFTVLLCLSDCSYASVCPELLSWQSHLHSWRECFQTAAMLVFTSSLNAGNGTICVLQQYFFIYSHFLITQFQIVCNSRFTTRLVTENWMYFVSGGVLSQLCSLVFVH